jgi:hypothetical protein
MSHLVLKDRHHSREHTLHTTASGWVVRGLLDDEVCVERVPRICVSCYR